MGDDRPKIWSMVRDSNSTVSSGGVPATEDDGGVVGHDLGYLGAGREKFSLARDVLRAWPEYPIGGEHGGLTLGTSAVVAVPNTPRSSAEKLGK